MRGCRLSAKSLAIFFAVCIVAELLLGLRWQVVLAMAAVGAFTVAGVYLWEQNH